MMAEYCFIGLTQGHIYANQTLVGGIVSGGYMLIYLSSNLGKMDIFRGYWSPIRIPYTLHEIVFPREVNPQNFVGENIIMEIRDAEKANLAFQRFFPLKGEIVDRKVIGRDLHWYLVRLRTPKNFGPDFHHSFVVIKFYEPSALPSKENNLSAYVRIIRESHKITALSGRKEAFENVGWVKVNEY
jgi:hypothetical protein